MQKRDNRDGNRGIIQARKENNKQLNTLQYGTYVDGYYRSERNNTNLDNFSTLGNYNPYTGSIGSIAQDYSIEAYNYGSGQTIYTGPQGGQYDINSNGNQTYVPKRNTSTSNTVGGYNYSEYNISTSNYSWLW